jgi:orotidine-5'-phosphate decarboxylase
MIAGRQTGGGHLEHMESRFAGRGLVVAADVADLRDLGVLVRETTHLEFIAGYKVGIELVGPHGFYAVCEAMRRESDLPLIYDHQKWGTDIPEISGGRTLGRMKEAGFDALIIFPFSGVETLRRAVAGCLENGLLPIVGGEMTHPGFLSSAGGYLESAAPERMYRDAAHMGASAFVVPGTKPDRIVKYKTLIESLVGHPTFFFPGIGRGQGGDIVEAFKAASPNPSYAIVGRGIYAETDRAAAAHRLWSTVEAAHL